MACRDKQRSEVARDKIIEITKNKKVYFEVLDLASFESIRCFVKIFKEKWNRLDILINNAGVFLSEYTKTVDGYEAHFGINHLGHFLLTNLLIDFIIKTGSSRVINLSSELHKCKTIFF
jgi:NAD(P)-dependent dehydrogenase (short-subunit alcohol dehydrogenase family)